ncbi:hypothetical protein SteCoe_13148 [Stentor coeruleus]|uniref:ERAP1-like C-terminal domain-containing protein n=1 Tax=Stentor coeruleus TaxID=5963 RepID=A0A1R2C970_9CILI|nr:hypothetical protein SteCoe_13148 [Stentor coeruleus]
MLKIGSFLRRFYFGARDLAMWQHDMMVSMVPNFINCRQHLDFLNTNEGQIPPKVLGDMMTQIAGFELDLDEYWPDICKHVKKIIFDYDRHVITELYRVTRAMGQVGEGNQEFWDLIEKKFMKDGLVRYLNEAEAAKLLWAMCKVGRGSDALWKRLENEVARHYVTMETEDLNEAIYALEVSGKGDPNVVLKLKSRVQANELALLP